MSLLGAGETEEGIKNGEKCLEIVAPKIDNDPYRLNFVATLYYAIGWGYFHLWELYKRDEDSHKAYCWWQHGWELWPDDIDLNFELTVMGYLAFDKNMMQDHGIRYLRSMEKYRTELDMPLVNFENTVKLDDLAIGCRHVHHATSKHEGMIRAILREAA